MVEKDPAIELVLQGLREGLPEYAAAQKGGVSFPTWWNWKCEVPGLKQKVDAAKRSRVILYEDALHKAAIKGSVNACLVLLRKESKEWRELIDGQIVPAGHIAALGEAAAAGAVAVLRMLSPEKKLKLKIAMQREGMLELPPPTVSGSGNGTGH